jgi:hypothetical protein
MMTRELQKSLPWLWRLDGHGETASYVRPPGLRVEAADAAAWRRRQKGGRIIFLERGTAGDHAEELAGALYI